MTRPLNKYFQKLNDRATKAETNLCVGLDPDPNQLPVGFAKDAEGVYNFLIEMIQATAEYAVAYKPNLAFFESLGLEGIPMMAQALESVPPEIPVILDAKRSDIGTTARHYAKAMFDVLKGDAVTINPLMGGDSVAPFLEREDKGIYLLCLTSNPGAEDFETWFDLYIQIAKKASQWNLHNNCGMVIGATKPRQLMDAWAEAPDIPLLVPGVGAQGGDLELIVGEARGKPRHSMIVNVSRSILYASQNKDYARMARKAAQTYRDRINAALKK